MADTVTVPVEGQAALQRFLMSRVAAIPDDVRAQLVLLVTAGDAIAACTQSAELIYARRDELPPELLAIGAALATMCAGYNLHGLGIDFRGFAMAATIQAMPGVQAPPPAVLEAPEPLPQFAAPSPDPAPPAASADVLPGPQGDTSAKG